MKPIKQHSDPRTFELAENDKDIEKRLRDRGSDRWLTAYYFGFDSTGVDEIDVVLAAVALAGKGAHGTEDWNDPIDYYTGIEEFPASAAEVIQAMANRSSRAVAALQRENAILRNQCWDLATNATESAATDAWDDEDKGQHVVDQLDAVGFDVLAELPDDPREPKPAAEEP